VAASAADLFAGATGNTAVYSTPSFKVGESHTEFYNAGVSGKGLATGGSSTLVPHRPAGAEWARSISLLYAWRVQVTLASVTAEDVTFDVDWNRYDITGDTPQPIAGDRRTIKLRPGARHVLDLLDLTSQNLTETNLVLELEVPRDDAPRAEYANATLAYEVWLVHEPMNGQKVTERLNVAGRDGQAVPFRFTPLAFSLDAAPQAGGAAGPIKVTVEGSVKGRIRPDGGVDLAVQSGRLIQCTPGLTARETGTKSFVVKPDETTGIEFPFVNGYCPIGAGSQPANPRPGVVTGDDGKLRVNFKEFFAGDKTSILVTVKRQG